MIEHDERVSTARRLLLEDLVRPYDPQLCGYVLLACVEILFEEPVGKAATKAAVKKLDLNPVLDAFVVFFCAPRSKVELQALHERTACHCDLDEVREDESAQHLHALGMKCFLEALQHHQLHPLHPILTTVLTKVWARCNMRWRRKEPKLYRTGLQPLTSCPAGSEWPQSMYQLLPYGPEDTMRGFIQWLASWVKLDLNTRVQMLIWVDALAIACHTEVIPYIITSRTLLAALIDMLGAIIDDWRPNAPKEDHRVLGPFVSVIGRHLNTLKDGMTPVEWAAFVAPFAADVVRRCDAMIPLCTDLASKVERPALTEVLYKETLPSFIIVGCGAYGRHPEAHPVIGDVSNIIRRGSVFSVKERDPWFRLLVHIRILHRRRRCCAPDCRRTWADLRQSAKLCQGCRQVQYCSITCQKNAWRHDVVPHRSVCVLLHHVCARFRLSHKIPDHQMYEPTDDKSFAPIGEVLVQYFDALYSYQLDTEPVGYGTEDAWNASRMTRVKAMLEGPESDLIDCSSSDNKKRGEEERLASMTCTTRVR